MMRIAILSGILFLSGIGALIFETVWLRLSGLAFGNSVWAAALILSSFMAGLALGNAIAASSKVRRWRPLHLYAVLELAVAVLGCTIVFGLPLLGGWLRPVWQTLWNYQPMLLGLRFMLSFVILLMPTTAMGLTLPVLMEDPILRRASFGRAIGFLYGSNTLGAVAGALVGEAYLIEAFGLRGTGLAAGLASCIAAAIALVAAAPGRKLPASVASAFRQLRDGGHPSLPGGGLVPVFALVCRFIINRFRGDARGGAGRDRIGQHCGGRDSPPLGANESIASYPFAAGRDCSASLIFVLSG